MHLRKSTDKKFLYASRRDVIQDPKKLSTSASERSGFYTPVGVTSFRTTVYEVYETFDKGFLYASRRDVIQDREPNWLARMPTRFYTPVGVTSFRTLPRFGLVLTCGDVGSLHRSPLQDRRRRAPWVQRPHLC